MAGEQRALPPILSNKDPSAPSEFLVENLLREGRRQLGLPDGRVPEVCLLDPDGDVLRFLIAEGRATRCESWACYHTTLYVFDHDGLSFGIVGCAVGASFAVLVAEEMFASGCELLLSVTSSGQLRSLGPTPYFVVIDRALRDEGTSYHYLPPSEFSDADPPLADAAFDAALARGLRVHRGAAWTTDAPFRETARAIAANTARGLLAVEMESAALYAFARARKKNVLCFAHVTNTMAKTEGDFEKGRSNGAHDALALVTAVVDGVRPSHRERAR